MAPRICRRLSLLFALAATAFFPSAARAAGVTLADDGKIDLELRARAHRAPRGLSPLSGVSQPVGFGRALIKLKAGAHVSQLAGSVPGLVVRSSLGEVVTAEVPLASLGALAASSAVEFVESARKGKPNLDVVRSNSEQSGPLYLGSFSDSMAGFTSDGTGVIVGVVDTGIDFSHEDFITGTFGNAAATSRILWLWDQTDTVDTAQRGPKTGPGGAVTVSTGAVWTQTEITDNVNGGGVTTTVRETDTNGHGTHVAGIAAGDGSATDGTGEAAGTYKGMAPAADLVVVKTTFYSDDVCNAINFIKDRATATSKKAVINLSMGFWFGSHDGVDALDACIDAAVTTGDVVVVVANGNEAQLETHAHHPFTGATESHAFDVAWNDGGSLGTGQRVDVELWHGSLDTYSVTVTLNGVAGSVGPVTAGNTSLDQAIGGATIDVQASVDRGSGRRRTWVAVETGSEDPGFLRVSLTRTASGGDGEVDGYVDSDHMFLADVANSSGSVGVPATSKQAISVGAYNTKQQWIDETGSTAQYSSPETLGALASFSSRGPTRDGRTKPDLSAPGFGVASSWSQSMSPAPPVTKRLRDGRHMILEGTSMAAPAVAGAAAIVRQTFPTLAATAVKTRLLADARVDGSVTQGNSWGQGKLAVGLKPRSAPATSSTTVSAVNATDIVFSWSSVSDASTYDLYYGTDQAKLHKASATTSFLYTTTPNQIMGFFVRGRNPSGTGPGLLTPFACTSALGYPSTGQATPTVVLHVTSMTVTYSGCASVPGGCNGFEVRAATSTDFAGMIFSSATTNASLLTLTVTGLTASTAYHLRVGNTNQVGVSSFTARYGPFTTNNPLLRPDPAPFSGVTSAAIQYNWLSGGNPFGTNYRAQAFSDAARTAQVGADQNGINVFSSVFSSLSPGTSYWFRVTPTQGAQTGPSLDSGPQATLAGPPAPGATPLAAASAVALTAAWTANGNGGAAVYEVEVSSHADFSSAVTRGRTQALTLALGGLQPNMLYNGRVRGITGFDGSASAWVSLGTARTQATPPAPTGFTGQSAYGFTANYDNGGNSGTPTFRVELSLSATFNLGDDVELDMGTAQQAAFSNLRPNRQYFFRAATYNSSGVLSAYGASASTYTVPAPVGLVSPHVLARTASTIRLAFAEGATAGVLNPAGTTYEGELYDNAGLNGAPVAGPANTTNLYFDFAGLNPHTVYYARVRATGAPSTNQPSQWTALSGGATLTDPLGAPPAFQVGAGSVTFSSVTLTWTSIAACSGYKVEASTSAAFTGTIYANTIWDPNANKGGVAGLPSNTQIFARVGPVNQDGVSNPTNAPGSATTFPRREATVVVTGAGGSTFVVPEALPLTRVTLEVPPGAFPSGTAVTLNTSVGMGSLPDARSNQARLRSAGSAAGFELTAGGNQPLGVVRVTASYDPSALPADVDERSLQVARYDEASGQWTLEPTFVDAAGNSVTAELRHFSIFGLFGVAAASELESVQIFPIPWEVNSRDSQFSASALTISNVPSGARVRIFNITGELVWDGPAAVNGVLTWRGDNKWGGKAATGTYLISLEGAGKRVVKRAVVIR